VSGSGTLNWSAYSTTWTVVNPVSCPLGRNVRIRGVFTDPESLQHNIALLVFDDTDSDTQYFFQVLKDPDLKNGLFGPPLFDNPAYSAFTKEGLGSNEFFVTADGIIGFEDGSNSWVRFTPEEPDTESRLYAGKRKENLKSAFSFSGGYYCTWDPDSRTLVRMEKWW
jgi:hypothetical protein